MQTFLSRLSAAWQRFNCRIQEARRLRLALSQLDQMSAHELRDIGVSTHAMAFAAAAHTPSRCR